MLLFQAWMLVNMVLDLFLQFGDLLVEEGQMLGKHSLNRGGGAAIAEAGVNFGTQGFEIFPMAHECLQFLHFWTERLPNVCDEICVQLVRFIAQKFTSGHPLQ